MKFKFTEGVGTRTQSFECETIQDLIDLRAAIHKADQPVSGEPDQPATEEGVQA